MPALVPAGAQQWMWDAVAGDTRPEKRKFTESDCAASSAVMVAVPVAGEAVGGFTCAPVSVPANTVIVANAGADVPSIRTAAACPSRRSRTGRLLLDESRGLRAEADLRD